jgi:hypothetical protein
MSNYYAKAYNPKTQIIEEAEWLDNHFGPHLYGIKFGDGNIWPQDECGMAAMAIALAKLKNKIDLQEKLIVELDQKVKDLIKVVL